MLLDAYGRPMAAATPTQNSMSVPTMRGGEWIEQGADPYNAARVYGIDRETERKASRVAFFSNPLIAGLVGNILVPYVVGDDFSYGTLDDKDAQLALDEFWSLNNLAELGERIWTEYLIDGESAVVFERDAPKGEASRIGVVDLDKGIKLEHNTFDGVTAIETQGPKFTRMVFEKGEFVWTAHNSFFNDPRGWPVMMQAIPSALSYIGLINARLKMHDLAGRINGIYTQLYNPDAPDRNKVFADKADSTKHIPRDGNIVSLIKDNKTGNQETLELFQGAKGASDAAADARLLRLLLSAALAIPPHWLGDAEDSNRASASEMNGPPLIAMKRRQSTFRSIMTRVFRLELLRRFGPDKRYLVRYSEVKTDPSGQPTGRRTKTKRVPAELIEPPFVFPQLDSATLDEIIRKVEVLAKLSLAGTQTQQELLDVDPALEAERLGNTPTKTVPIKEQEPTDGQSA